MPEFQDETVLRVPVSGVMRGSIERAIEAYKEQTGQRLSLAEFMRRAAERFASDVHAGNANPWAP